MLLLAHQVPIIFAKTDTVKNGKLGDFVRHQLKGPYILVTGQSDYGIPVIPNARKVLSDPNLVAWFAQHVEEPTPPKLKPIPIGLQCFEQGPELHEAKKIIGER